MQGFLARGVYLLKEPLSVDPYFHLLAFKILIPLTILDEHLTNSIMVEKQLIRSSNHIIIIIIPLLTLCGKRDKQAHCPWAAERFKSKFSTLQGKPKHTPCGYSQSHTCDFSPFFPYRGSGPPNESTECHATIRRQVMISRAPVIDMGPKFERWEVCPLPRPIRY